MVIEAKICDACGAKFFPTAKRFRREAWEKRRFCGTTCAGNGGPRRPSVSIGLRFWDKVNKASGHGPEGECWEWTGSRNRLGYGAVRNERGLAEGAHRVSYLLAHGHIPDGLFVCHRCDNPPCVNPAHLFLGTTDDNMKDMAEKGRGTRGEKSYHSKLTAQKVREIRADTRLHRVIAEEYGVSMPTISTIKSRKIWAHLQD